MASVPVVHPHHHSLPLAEDGVLESRVLAAGWRHRLRPALSCTLAILVAQVRCTGNRGAFGKLCKPALLGVFWEVPDGLPMFGGYH